MVCINECLFAPCNIMYNIITMYVYCFSGLLSNCTIYAFLIEIFVHDVQ